MALFLFFSPALFLISKKSITFLPFSFRGVVRASLSSLFGGYQ
jgi:hypothetical protein